MDERWLEKAGDPGGVWGAFRVWRASGGTVAGFVQALDEDAELRELWEIDADQVAEFKALDAQVDAFLARVGRKVRRPFRVEDGKAWAQRAIREARELAERRSGGQQADRRPGWQDALMLWMRTGGDTVSFARLGRADLEALGYQGELPSLRELAEFVTLQAWENTGGSRDQFDTLEDDPRGELIEMFTGIA